ncbi:hypothetical protein H4Q26_003209 [Puccinia striiformis f. sp. tritici PST-130]|nr:hypothetical protein H4Q26_003209 [Puccinia striiformis f. sp. tritici PST-130]
MNSFVIDPTLIKFKGPNYARFCVSGVWSQGQRLCSVSLRTDVSQPTALNVGSTYEISGEVEGLNAYLMPILKLLLGWNYCHVDQAINAFEGSRIAYVGSMQGRDKGDGTPIVEVPKATLNFVGGMLDRGEECLETELSDDFIERVTHVSRPSVVTIAMEPGSHPARYT